MNWKKIDDKVGDWLFELAFLLVDCAMWILDKTEEALEWAINRCGLK